MVRVRNTQCGAKVLEILRVAMHVIHLQSVRVSFHRVSAAGVRNAV